MSRKEWTQLSWGNSSRRSLAVPRDEARERKRVQPADCAHRRLSLKHCVPIYKRSHVL